MTTATILRETTTSENYDVPGRAICERLPCRPETLSRYQNRKLIPRGKRRKGLPGIFFTAAQADKLLKLKNSKAERFGEYA